MRSLYLIACVTSVACQEPTPLYPASAPLKIRQACELTERKCTACHDRDRIVDARYTELEWRTTVDRMRRFPGSGISAAESEVIVGCLSYRVETFASPTSQHTLDDRSKVRD